MEPIEIDVILVDDHTMFLDGLTEILHNVKEINIIGTAKSGKEALELIAERQPDILISDIRMNKMDGYELSKKVQKLHPEVKILIVSMHNESITINMLIEAGVMGYILKNTGKKELITALHKINAGETYFSHEVQHIYMDSLVNHKKKKQSLHLTRREKEIINLIAAECTTNEIAEKLFISLNTVETHRKNILRKLNVKNSVGLIKKCIELDLLSDSPF